MGAGGAWNVGAESAVLHASPGKIVFRFHSRDLHIVLGPAKSGRPVRFRVRLDGVSPGRDCGVDSAPDGGGEISEPRLYQLIRQRVKLKTGHSRSSSSTPGLRLSHSLSVNRQLEETFR